ncbi:3-hydroxyisobutyrate dehydrogenase-like beta-hydroxyacid dehydrogenase [Edaphobacter lichenicola]|jgi:3-hydroxyisobutyrate dehydrogenase-like beta-hydroxyacid dehydrogenase|uniref:3-hydroxyisobutyrate dehydrogenase-like beta-hydroxyacid dehydrogenase n=1 Tax=Tunturiibacter gelidiferens TaxID=3069689 RepID=A0A9X0QEP5_9BACT|nr:3-hydroxyisobutyrate dehydrogenase-like beta-hydroxyacid dehydrogenase [Edaphobacter lichenicola]
MELGIIGLGKMGFNMTERLRLAGNMFRIRAEGVGR